MADETPEEGKAQRPPEGEVPIRAADLERRRKRNSIILALALFAFVVLVFIITLVRVGHNVFNNPPM
jgi:hypothetical protein